MKDSNLMMIKKEMLNISSYFRCFYVHPRYNELAVKPLSNWNIDLPGLFEVEL